MTKMLDILEDYLHLRSYPYCRLDGSTDGETREKQIEHFREDPDQFVFLLSTRAGKKIEKERGGKKGGGGGRGNSLKLTQTQKIKNL